MPQRIRPLLNLVAAAFLCLALFDTALFRSGVYAIVAEPESTAGSLVRTTMKIDGNFQPGKRNILVLGDSRIGEGFSMPLADAAANRADLHFINGSIAGTTPRVWNYLLREIDPDATRFAAIVMMLDYDLADQRQNLLDRRIDIAYLRPLLRIGDLLFFPNSFNDPALRQEARRAIILPMQAMHDDIRSLLASPRKRHKEITVSRPTWLAATVAYPGRPQTLPDLAIDAVTGMPDSWNGLDKKIESRIRGYFQSIQKVASDSLQTTNMDYLLRWLPTIVDRYHAAGIPVIVFSIPRGPWISPLVSTPPQPNAAIAALQINGKLVALPGAAFTNLEHPQYFVDELHLNSVGREEFSRRLAQRVASLLH